MSDPQSIVIPANDAKVHFEIAGEAYPVVSLYARESLSSAHRVKVVCARRESWGDNAQYDDRPAVLTFTAADGHQRRFVGYIYRIVRDTVPGPGGWYPLQVHFGSRLTYHHLIKGRYPELWLGRDVEGLLRTVLAGQPDSNIPYPYHRNELRFDLHREHPVWPYKLRGPFESDRAYVNRLLAECGVYFRTDPARDTLTFTDHIASCPYVPQGTLSYHPPAALERRSMQGRVGTGIFAITSDSQATPDLVSAGVSSGTRPTTAQGPATVRVDGGHDGLHHQAHTGAAHYALAEQWSKDQAEHYASRHLRLRVFGNRADLSAGHCVSLDTAGSDAGVYAGDYLIGNVVHRFSQAAGQHLPGETFGYNNYAQLIPLSKGYRPARPRPKPQPEAIEANVMGQYAAPYCQLTESGEYQLRLLFDNRLRGDGIQRIRKLSPYASPPKDAPAGFHFGLHHDQRVLVTCVNNDPDQMLVLTGTLFDADWTSPVVDGNRTANVLRTPSGNELSLEDWVKHEHIKLRDAGFNLLELNADVDGHLLTLHGPEAAMWLKAHKAMELWTGADLIERVGGSRTHTIEDDHSTTTKEGDLHHQAATDMDLTAGNTVSITSGEDTQLITGGSLDIDVTEQVEVTVNGPQGFVIHVLQGSMTLHVAKDIIFRGKGEGDIVFTVNGAGIKIDRDGNVTIFGNTINLFGKEGVYLNGDIYYQVPGGEPVPIPKVSNALPTTPIQRLDPDNLDTYGAPRTALDLSYKTSDGKGIEGLEYCVTCRDGSALKGTLDANGEAHLSDVLEGPVTVDWGDPKSEVELETELDALRSELSTTLDGIVAEVEAEAARLNAALEREGLLGQGLIYTGAFLDGLWQSGKGTVVAVKDLVVTGAEVYANVQMFQRRAWRAILRGDLEALEANLRELAADGKEHYRAAKDTYDQLQLLLSDPQVREMLLDFPPRYLGAHSDVEKVHMAGGLSLDIILALLTGGAIAALKGSKLVAQASQLLKKIAELLKKIRLKRKRRGHTDERQIEEVEVVPRSTGDLFEDSVKHTFRNKILRENEVLRDKSGNVIGEIDFETDEALVEVGTSLRGKVGQLHKLAEIAKHRRKRLDVVYGPDTPVGTLEFLKESLRKKWGTRVRFIPHE